MPATWDGYGVDANGDGVADPYNPEDAIFAAASYLSASGMPADTYGAIFAYNHADWYVAEVLANAGCYAAEVGAPSFSAAGLGPQLQVLKCSPAPAWRDEIPARVPAGLRGRRRALRTRQARRLGAGRDRPPRVELRPRDGARSSCATKGPLGLDPSEWNQLRGRRRRGRAHPPRRPGRLGGDPGAADLVARQPQRRHLHPQPGRVVRAGGAAAGRRDRRRLQGPLRRLARWRRWPPASKPPAPARSSSGTSPAPRRARRPRSRRRSRRPTRSPPPPTSGAAATAPGTPTATTARARSASPSSAPACSTRRSPPARWRATANRARAGGSRSTPTPPTPTR